MSAIARRVSTRSRNRTVLVLPSSSDRDADVQLEDLVSPPPARASERIRARGVVAIRGRRVRVSNPRAARIQSSAPVVIPGQPATPPPIVVPSPRPLPRVRIVGPRGGRRPQARRHNSPPPPPTPPRRVERVNAVPLVDIRGTPAQPVANELVPLVKGNFECVVCMEFLSAPATIMENNQNQPNAADNPGVQGGFPELGVFAINLLAEFNGDMNIDHHHHMAYANFPRPGRRSTVNLAQINPLDVMTTPCGHMYHAYCIQKWFAEQGRRTCPSCRKNVPGKLIKLYPSINYEPDEGVQAEAAPAVSVPGGANLIDPNQGAQNGAQRANAVGPCVNPSCQDMRMLQQLLQGDNRDLQQRINEANDARAGMTENIEVLQAEVVSLQEDNNRLRRRNTELEIAVGEAEISTKRRRHK